MTLRLRTASLAGAEAIADLINLAFQVERFFIDGDRISVDEVRARFEIGKFIVAEDGGKLVGCVYVEPRGNSAYLGLLSIAPERQKCGIGKVLALAAEDFGRASGCLAMDLLIVNLREELPGFYRRLGYAETGVAPFPSGVKPKLPCHFVKMSKPLEPTASQSN